MTEELTGRVRHHRADTEDEHYYFTVHGKNGEIVVTSELYDSKANSERGAVTLMRILHGEDE